MTVLTKIHPDWDIYIVEFSDYLRLERFAVGKFACGLPERRRETSAIRRSGRVGAVAASADAKGLAQLYRLYL